MRGLFIFLSIVVVRFLGAVINVIDDCDETYNYWEPVHYLMYGTGYQTWEMSSEHALRSWVFPYIISMFSVLIPSSFAKYTVWVTLRGCLALIAAISEYMLYQVGVRSRWGPRAADYATALSLLSPGIFVASTALLPNTVSMVCFNFAFAALLKEWDGVALKFAAASVLFGVPFAGVIIVPMAMYIIFRKGFIPTFLRAVAVGSVMLGVQIALDWRYYGKLTCSLCNLVYYNALSSETDSTLYGVEPVSFYIKNLVLNMNVILPLAILGALALVAGRRWFDLKISVLPAVLWLALMFYLPHKESRFLFPIYSFLILSAAVALALLWKKLSVLILVVILVLSVSRVAALQVHYSAPRNAFQSLLTEDWGAFGEKVHRNQRVNLCLGGEWHQFPTSFILPSANIQMHFVRSSFDGLLPKPFGNSTDVAAAGMNLLNERDENHPWMELSHCDYFVGLEPPVGDEHNWRRLRSFQAVDQTRGSTMLRSFFVPLLSRQRLFFNSYGVFKRSTS